MPRRELHGLPNRSDSAGCGQRIVEIADLHRRRAADPVQGLHHCRRNRALCLAALAQSDELWPVFHGWADEHVRPQLGLRDRPNFLAECSERTRSIRSNTIDTVPRYIHNGRDYAMFVHTDPLAGLFITFYNAGMLLFEKGVPLNPGNPYLGYKKQAPFATFGVPFFLGMMGEVATRAFKAVWYAKWFVHRALRPEAFGGLVHMTITRQANYPLHRDILNSGALSGVPGVEGVFQKYGTYFHPQAFPEGSPQHPSYAQGHASMAGACATIVKAAVDGSFSYQSLPKTITPYRPRSYGRNYDRHRERGWAVAGPLSGRGCGPNYRQRRNRQAGLEHRFGTRFRRDSLAIGLRAGSQAR